MALAALCAAGAARAQQDAQYTNFMNNKLWYNPAVAGSKGAPVAYGLIRKQWFGLEGAPASQAVGFHLPLRGKRAGLGIVLSNDEIGFTRSTQATANYAYHVQVGDATYLSAGLSATGRQYAVDWDEARATDGGDGNIPQQAQASRMMLNFGTGVLLYNDKFYAGISAPRLMRNRLSLDEDWVGTSAANREDIHLYAMGGVMLPLTDGLALKPAALVKYVADAPVDIDLRASLVFAEVFSFGGTYRTGGSSTSSVGESIDVLASFQASDQFRFGVAYDFTLTKINEVSSGSAELFLEFLFRADDKRLTNPRFF